MAKKLTDIRVSFISLVRKPANGKKLILKGSEYTEIKLSVLDKKLKRAYGIVYPVDEVDLQGHTANAEEVLKASDYYMKSGRMTSVDENHDFSPKDAFVAENWIIKKDDPIFPEEKSGGWAVGIQTLSKDLWEKIEKGELTGISLAGEAKIHKSEDDDPPGWFEKWFKKEKKENIDMDTSKLEKMFENLEKKLEKIATPPEDQPVKKSVMDAEIQKATVEIQKKLDEQNKLLKKFLEKGKGEGGGEVSEESLIKSLADSINGGGE